MKRKWLCRLFSPQGISLRKFPILKAIISSIEKYSAWTEIICSMISILFWNPLTQLRKFIFNKCIRLYHQLTVLFQKIYTMKNYRKCCKMDIAATLLYRCTICTEDNEACTIDECSFYHINALCGCFRPSNNTSRRQVLANYNSFSGSAINKNASSTNSPILTYSILDFVRCRLPRISSIL